MFGMNHREKNAQKGVQKQLLNGLKVLVLGSEKLCFLAVVCVSLWSLHLHEVLLWLWGTGLYFCGHFASVCKKFVSLFILRSSLQSFDYITQRTSPYCLNLVKQAETRESNEIVLLQDSSFQTIL